MDFIGSKDGSRETQQEAGGREQGWLALGDCGRGGEILKAKLT